MNKKLLCFLTATIFSTTLLLNFGPIAFAETQTDLNYTQSIKLQDSITDQGTCGTDLAWKISDNGVLAIDGEGDMNVWENATDVPWHQYRNDINEIILSDKTTSIGSYSFYECSQVTNLIIPNSVLSIGEFSFYECNSLESITLPFVGTSRTVENTNDAVLGYVFGRCAEENEGAVKQYFKLEGTSIYSNIYNIPSSLKTVTITDSENIPFGSFSNCDNLTQINLPDKVKYVGGYAYFGCTSITSIEFPNSIETMGDGAIKNCTSIESLSIPFVGNNRDSNNVNTAVFGHIFGKVSTGVLQYYTMEDAKLKGFYYGIPSTLTKVTVTDATQIPFGAFSNCVSLAEININDQIKHIGGHAFNACSLITNFEFSNNIETIGESALKNCNNVESLSLPFVGSSRTSNHTADAVFGHIFGKGNSGISQVFNFDPEKGSLSAYYYGIPSTLTNIKITDAIQIPLGAFSGMTNLTRLDINSGITSIFKYAFHKSTGITDIYYNDTELEWDKINNAKDNTELANVTIHFTEEPPIIGYEINDVARVSENKLRISLSTPAERENNEKLIVAVYAENDSLLEMQTIDITETNSYDANINLAGSSYVKTFIWSGIDTMKPMCKSFYLDLK